jgi:hypothetical protein
LLTKRESTEAASAAWWNPTSYRGLIFDIGMHDGSDTAFYLHQGYAVVGVEADPTLAAHAHDAPTPNTSSTIARTIRSGLCDRRPQPPGQRPKGKYSPFFEHQPGEELKK